MTIRLRLLAMLAVICSAIALAGASPALASPALPAAAPVGFADFKTPPDSCTNYSVCGYVNTDYKTDQGYELIPEQAIGHCEVVTFRNAWSGVYNYTSRPIRLFKNTSCSGSDYKTIPAVEGRYWFSVQLGPTWDNSVDAYKTM